MVSPSKKGTAAAVSFYVGRLLEASRQQPFWMRRGRESAMDRKKLQWLRELVYKNNLHDFYSSSEWQTLAALARQQQNNECQRCKAKGYYSPCEIVHHIRYVKKYPELALSADNLECLCRSCHEEEHKKHLVKKVKEKKGRRQAFTNEERW